MCIQASTSIASAQMIATSSIISFDIYGTYINPKATNKDLIRWSHIGVVATAIVISSVATGFHYGGVDMTWLLYAMGNVVNPGVLPTCFALFWKRQSTAAAVAAPLVGVAAGISVWLSTAHAYFGELTVATTGSTLPCMFGDITAFFAPLPVTLLISWIFPADFDWAIFRSIKSIKVDSGASSSDEAEKDASNNNDSNENETSPEGDKTKYMKRMSRWATFWAIFTVVGHILLWPLPMYGAKIVFSKPVCFITIQRHATLSWVHPANMP